MRELINQPVSKIVIGDEKDKDVFVRATEVMKNDESSYRVRFVTQQPKDFTSLHSSRSVSSQSLAALASQTHMSYSPAQIISDFDRSSIHSSYSDLRLSTLNYPTQENSFSTVSASPTATPNPETSESLSHERSLSYPLTEWKIGNDTSTHLLDEAEKEKDDFLEMEGQGVLIYDNNGEPSHVSSF